MGKKARKTRWRTLAITSGEQSDSEESNSQSGQQQISKSYYPQKPYYSKFPYSSQSTPVRTRFQNDTKSTRSSSTTSENKITFNEDEYTKITTPRQDVLFKKGYLSKPKTYQTQTSTGNSTVSTGNSTGNGTPDHQSADGTEGTDLEYESQFVFPNGYVDPNGIYYINSFEPYPPLVVYNAPYCYPEYPATRSKRYSTDSLTESTSPHNEETSQDQSQSGGETFGASEQTKPLVNGHHCEDEDVTAQQDSENAEQRKVKKRRRRKLSKPVPDGTSSEDGDELVNRISEEAAVTTSKKVELKPDAKEFIPRAYQNVQFIPNFIPMPLISELHPAFLPPGIPINFIPPEKIMHNYVNFIPNYVPKVYETQPEAEPAVEEEVVVVQKPAEVKEETYKSNIDIEKIVSKLEEAAKEQRFYENRKQKYSPHKFNNNNNNKSFAKKFTPEKKPTRKAETTDATTKPETCSNMNKPNYAETLLKKKRKVENPVQQESPVKPKPAVLPNQWISVSRKKRRNKNTIEEVEIEDVQVCEEDEFETYDVDKLQDVIVKSVESEQPVTEVDECVEVVIEEKVEEVVEQKPNECDEIEELIRSLEEIEAKTNLLKKRSKCSKTRRVIITDVDLSQNAHEVMKSPVRIIKEKEDVENIEEKNIKQSNGDNTNVNTKNLVNGEDDVNKKSRRLSNEDNTNLNSNTMMNAKKQMNGDISQTASKIINQNETVKKHEGKVEDKINITIDLVIEDHTKTTTTDVEENKNVVNGEDEVMPKNNQSIGVENKDVAYNKSNKIDMQPKKNEKLDYSKKNQKNEKLNPAKVQNGVQITKVQDNNAFENIQKVCEVEELLVTPKPLKVENNIIKSNTKVTINVDSSIDSEVLNETMKSIDVEKEKKNTTPKVITENGIKPSEIIKSNGFDRVIDDEVQIEIEDGVKVNSKKSKPNKKIVEVLENGTNVTETPKISDDDGVNKINGVMNETLNDVILDEFKVVSGPKKQKQQKRSSIKNNNQKLDDDVDVKNQKLDPCEVSKNLKQNQEVIETESVELEDFESLSNLKVKKSSKKTDDVETPEKKRCSKKKKKSSSTSSSSSAKSKTSVTRNFDEPYDYLMNNTFQENEKTNVEISEELSKMIQRGMYSSLEEKIKSLNITAANDGFFKTISYADTTEKRNDLTNVVNTSNLFKPKRSIEDIDLNKLKLPSLEPSVSGSFLDLSNEQKDPGIGKDSLYPITQAVKDWMTKTRETTPEVEILKSPSTILKEVLQNGDDVNNEEEEVIFSKDWSLTPETSFEEDVLEWDDEIEAKNTKIDIAEDVLDVYESKYGKNEDYAKIKAEIEEKKRNGTFPKHGNLPYRAICCSLM